MPAGGNAQRIHRHDRRPDPHAVEGSLWNREHAIKPDGTIPASDDRDLEAVATLVAKADRVVVLTGAGVSAESKIPTFRDAMEGLWASFDPQSLATPEAWDADPKLVSEWYDFRRQKCAEAEPNPGHHALAHLEQAVTGRGGSFLLVTQNVDGLHRRAGTRELVEVHGSLAVWRCTTTGEEFTDLPERFDTYPPPSPAGGLLRPGVVWFGEMLPAEAVERAERATAACDLFLSVGTSSVVYPAAGFAIQAAQAGATVVEINPDDTPLTEVMTHTLRGRSGILLPKLVEAAFRP